MNEPEFVYIGRNTIYGNPVRRNHSCTVCGKLHNKIEDVLVCYKRYLFWRLKPESENLGKTVARRFPTMPGSDIDALDFRKQVLALDGKILICPGCGRGNLKCHGRTLEAAVGWLKKL